MVGGDNGKTTWIIANWKSNKSISEALEWVSQVGHRLERESNIKVIVCPTFSCLTEVKKEILTGGFPMLTGVQDLSPFDVGPYTGEEAAKLLKDFVDLAIIGHSERRKNFGETDQMVSQKVQQALTNDIIPLVCVQDENTPVPEGVEWIAYEPPNAISTSGPDVVADTPEDAVRVSKLFKQKYTNLEVLYGGSVVPSNVSSFLNQEALSGVLVGGASLDASEFLKIVEASYGQK